MAEQPYNYYFAQSTIVPIWGNIDVIYWKFQILFFGVGELLFQIPIFIMWGLMVIPSVTPLWQYCAIYYIVLIPACIINMFMASSRSKELFLFAAIANIFTFVVISWVLGLNLYDVISCWLQTIPQTCRNTMLADMIVSGFTIILEIFAFIIMIAYIAVCGRIAQSNSVRGITLRNTRTMNL